MKIFIKQSQLFPSFHTICNDLKLEEIELDHLVAQGPASVFYSAPSGGGHPPPQQLPPRPPHQELSCPPMAFHLLPPTPTTVTNARVTTRGRGKARTTASATTAVTIEQAPRCGPPSTIPRLAPSLCGQRCILHSSSQCVHDNTPCSMHWHTTGLPAVPPSRPCRLLHRTSNKTQLLLGHPRRACGISSHWPTPSTPWP
jgi:hypothetical protein